MTPPSFSSAFTEAGGVPPSRQAALFLRSVGLDDRRWLLGQLGAAAGRELTRLIEELDALGIEPATGTGRVVVHAMPSTVRDGGGQSPSISALAAEVMAAPMHDVLHEMLAAPDALIHRLLRHTESGWTRRFLACLDLPQRARLELGLQSEGAASATTSTAIDLALLQALARRLASSADLRRGRLGEWMSFARATRDRWLGRAVAPQPGLRLAS